jgi:hypothetical protein
LRRKEEILRVFWKEFEIEQGLEFERIRSRK